MKKKQHNTPPHERLDLPFASRGGGWVEWVYDHRWGLLAVAGVYLLLAVGIVTVRITLAEQAGQEVWVDLAEMERLLEERERLEAEVQDLQAMQSAERAYHEAIRNEASNATGEFRNTPSSQLLNEAQAVQDRIQASGEAYERSLREAQGILDDRPQQSTGDGEGAERGRAKGRVTVEYYLPGRTDRSLPVPAYQCPGGGTVVIRIEADRNGNVSKASVSESESSADPCLRDYALRAARSSRFDVAQTNAQAGTITYEFVAQ